MKTPKKLIVTLIDREIEIHKIATRLEKAGVSVKGLELNIDLMWLAAGVDPESVCEFDDPIFEGFGKGHTAEEIYGAMRQRIAEANK